MKILLACERSAGHIFPALCFARKLLGTKSNLSQASAEAVYFFITSAFLKSYIEKEGFKVVGRALRFRNLFIEGIFRPLEALYLILTLRPDRVIGFGGRDSFFLVLFSALLLIETTIYEPNIKMGRANRFLSPFVHKILRAFEDSKQNKKITTVGVPLRENIRKIDKAEARKMLNFNEKPVLLCLGGSQGSAFINATFVRFVEHFSENYQIIHLTGKNGYSQMLERYKRIKNNKFIKDFYYMMEVLYSAADIVISRAGASTLAEIAFYRLPSILIPHPKAGGHQKQNASYFKERESAFVIWQDNFSFDSFSNLLKKLICDNNVRYGISSNLAKIKLGIDFENFCANTYF